MTEPLGQVGPYALLEPLGEGAHARVFRAEHRPTGRAVAFKVLHNAEARAMDALRREVEAVAALSHPHIIDALDVGRVPEGHASLPAGAPWVVLELATHGALSERPPRRYLSLQHALVQVLSALAHAHARGVVHRDLKPANVLRSRKQLKVADFGLAWALGDADQEGPRVAGTPEYMAPEQVRGELDRIGPWTDLYALGCMAWELATGRPPFHDLPVRELLQAQLSAEPGPFLPVIDLPEGFEAWVRGLLEKPAIRRGDSAALACAELVALGTEVVDGLATPLSTDEVDPRTWSASLVDWDGPLLEPELAAPPPTFVGPREWLLPRERWQEGQVRRPPLWLLGGGLGLFALRAVPLVGRFDERDRLWETLRRVADRRQAEAVALWGEPGVGVTSLGDWLARAVVEGGYGEVVRRGDPRLAGPPEGVWERLRDAAHRGLVLVWLDEAEASERALARFVAEHGVHQRAPVLIVVGARRAPSGLPSAEVGPLPEASVEELLRRVVGLSPGLERAIARRVGGLPADALRLLEELAARGELVVGPDGFEASAGLDHLSTTHAEAAAQRVRDVLPDRPEAWAPVQLAALLGPGAPHGAWLDACRHAGVEADPAVFEGLLQHEDVSWDSGWSFRSAVVADAVLRPLTPEARQRLAVAAADALAARPRLARLIPHRSELELEAGRPERALVLAERDLWTDHERRGRGVTVARRAVEAMQAPPGSAERVLVELLALRLRISSDGLALLERAKRWLDELSPPVRARVVHVVATLAADLGVIDDAVGLWREAVAVERSPRNLRMLGLVLWHAGEMAEAEALCIEGLHAARAADDVIEEMRGLNDVADWARVHGRLDEAEPGFREALRLSVAQGLGLDLVPRLNLIDVLRRRGRAREALDEARDLVRRTDRRPGSRLGGSAAVFLAACAADVGEEGLLDEALERLAVVPLPEIAIGGAEGVGFLLLAAERIDPHRAGRVRDLVGRLDASLQARGEAMLPELRAAVPKPPATDDLG